jgi:hypothetical protein
MLTLTHWKKLRNPEYLGAYALQPNEELILTIKKAGVETIIGVEGKKEDELVIHFMEDYKPMIVNSTNAKTISKVHKTPYVEEWVGKKIQVYARRIRAFGEDMDALRVRDFIPQTKEVDVTKAVAIINQADTLDALKKAYSSLTKEEQGHPDVVKAKDKRKGEVK